MAEKGPSELRLAYKLAVKRWIEAIREEESLAVPDHTTIDMDEWKEAHFKEDLTRENAKEARDAYKDALRKIKTASGLWSRS